MIPCSKILVISRKFQQSFEPRMRALLTMGSFAAAQAAGVGSLLERQRPLHLSLSVKQVTPFNFKRCSNFHSLPIPESEDSSVLGFGTTVSEKHVNVEKQAL